ncbi:MULTISPECIES: efflux RND transporter periplasmic adaptor subunit [Burkholderia cepacia complex]|uniref:efflux RND transporter periplasmic adaptor subunit n=1 Tax=Burkholderia cepacia complex TaxID=87882 RepID=UPI001CF1368E|nr:MULTISPECIES: HlyD family secretion protein [Burkholderia cepacia complex]MCA8057375.1 HlyD family secretion protein [Burkholderia cepacia]MDN7535200.1 HlyD family secretion protein [Burkholderia orbicola]
MKSTTALPVLVSRVVLTFVFVGTAIVAGHWLWKFYQVDPWTRDGRIRIDVASVAPDVSGLVTQVYVVDNMPVQKGQPLFVIDRQRYEQALQQAESSVQAADAGLEKARADVLSQMTLLGQARREDARNRKLGTLVPIETLEQGAARVRQLEASVAQANAQVSQAKAAISQAIAARNTARLNLGRTTIVAPVNGIAANVGLRPGDYLSAGHAAFGIADESSLHIDGYFEETKVEQIHIGDLASIQLMGSNRRLEGHVQSIAPGIEDRERAQSGGLLANINPTFNWVRLAQRIPVRVHIDHAPSDVRLIAGRTATVIVHPGNAPTGTPRGGQ